MWASQLASDRAGHSPVGLGASSFLDALLADDGEDGSAGGAAAGRAVPLAAEAHCQPSAASSAVEPIVLPPSSRESAIAMSQLQREAARLWAEHVQNASVAAGARSARPKTNSWHRRKKELQQLRDQVERLQDDLQERKKRATDLSSANDRETQRRRIRRQQQYVCIAWKLEAEREEKRKSASLTENARLKSLVERHAELSRTLRSALSQQEADAASLPRLARLHSSAERASLFIALEQKLSARLSFVEEIVRSTLPSASRQADKLELNVNGDASGQPVGSIQYSKTFPFNLRSVAEMVWRCAENGFREVSLSSEAATRLSENALGMDAVVRLPTQSVDGLDATFHVRGVIKRSVTADCVLIQFACLTEWLADESYATEEVSWSVLHVEGRHRCRRLATIGDRARMQSSIESSLISPARPQRTQRPSRRMHRELIANTVLPSLSAVIKRMDQVVENTLLDDARVSSA